MVPKPPFPDDRDEKISCLYSYWLSVKKRDGLPSRKDIDPVAIPRLLPNIWLIDVVPPVPRFRYRLVGTAVVEARGYDQTGSFFDLEVPEFSRTQAFADLHRAMAGEPSWRRGDPDKTHRLNNIYNIERIFLPLANDGRLVNIVMALTVFHSIYLGPPRFESDAIVD